MRGLKGAKVLIFLLIFSFLFIQAGAAANDFSATAGAGFSACSCSTVQGAINVRNTGDSLSSFFVSQSGPLAGFSTVFPDSFVLAPGEDITINEYLRIPCSAEGGYSLITDIKTELGLQKQIVQDISASKCVSNAATNATLYQRSASKKPIIFLLLSFLILLAIIIVIALLFARKPSPTEKRPEKKPKKEPYWWEAHFAEKEKENDEQVYRKFLKRGDNKLLKIIILIIIAILLLSFIANYVLPPSANYTINATNVTFLPFGSITTSTFKPEVMQAENVTFINPAEFAVPYASFIISGIVILLALIFGIRFMREREKNSASKNNFKPDRKKLFVVLLILAVLAAIAAAAFYGSRISSGKNTTDVSALAKIAEAQQMQNKTLLPVIFSEESAETAKSYIPYVLAGMLILAAIIIFLKLVEKK